MSCYFIVQVNCYDKHKRKVYDEYIQEVKPIIESYQGKYIIRSENILSIDHQWQPDRFIVIEFPDQKHLDQCFHSPEYLSISQKRENNVESHAIIVGGTDNENM
ncbi:DUF1330 domain-containing protein [Candidatus Stoquefichus massiliensis]|uniref:DUF1330 domain-containing protein n=1 Tax=Candidatus Stoquefichus massiliensis TaxID=1470350 RepID=UPI000482966A|nr:DUF1330 domain-containing protein [Candidatus Stoquefichus massiliensis]